VGGLKTAIKKEEKHEIPLDKAEWRSYSGIDEFVI
jgi:hypothetical protein